MPMSQSVTYVTPPPNAGPLMAATMGLPKPTNDLKISASPIEIYDASTEGCTGPSISSNLAAAQKYEPRPVTTTEDVAASLSKIPSMQSRPRDTAASSELLFLGRLYEIKATPSATYASSTGTSSSISGPVRAIPAVLAEAPASPSRVAPLAV